MSAMASNITSLTIVYSTVYSGADQKKTSKLRVTGLRQVNSPMTGEFPAQMVSNAENVSIWWRYHVTEFLYAVFANFTDIVMHFALMCADAELAIIHLTNMR